MNRVIHFELNADDPQRAIEFYEKVFGWNTNKWEGEFDYWLVNTGEEDEPGINGGIMKRQDGQSTVNTIGVDSIDNYTEKTEEAGGEVLMGKTAVPGVGYSAYIKDTEGNVIGLMEEDTDAK